MKNNISVAYASRATDNKKVYATLEKEMTSIAFRINKFCQYIYAKHVIIETNHKPLIYNYKKKTFIIMSN